MNTYLVTYLLDNTESDYSRISAKIRSFPHWLKLYPRTWLIRSNMSTRRVRTLLSDSIDGKGTIFVMNVTDSSWASYRLDNDITDWLKENV